MYVDRLTIENFRCFEQVEMDFNWPDRSSWNERTSKTEPRLPNINLLIGNNGTGKTTTFQALVISALRVILGNTSSGFRTARIIRYSQETAEVSAKMMRSDMDKGVAPDEVDTLPALSPVRAKATIKRQQSTEFIETRGLVPSWADVLYDDKHPGLFIAAYGAGRRTERPEAYNERLRAIRYQRVASLFESHVGLIPTSRAFTQCRAHERWEEVISLMNELLPLPVHLTEKLEDDIEPLFDYGGIPLPVSYLSDGYRLFVSWVIDLLTHLALVLPKRYKLSEAVGIVIVDEVDLFLAPRWQRTVLESLSCTFPGLQWLCSTHSPLVASSLDNENIYILEQNSSYTSYVRRPTSKFEGKSVDEVLIELFDVQQPRSPQLQRQLSELAQQAMAGDLDASLLYLRRLNEGSRPIR